MALMLTRAGLLGRIHRATESSKTVRTGLVTATASAAGLAMGRLGASRKAPLAAAGGGLILSLMGMSALGDGLAASGATLIGYRTGAKMGQKKLLPVAPVATVRPSKKGR